MTNKVKLDWLAGTFPARNLDAVRALVATYLGEAEDRDYGLNFYARSAAWAAGALLAWSEGRQDAYVSLPATAINYIPPKRLRAFLADLDVCGFRASRADVALDDYAGDLRLDDVEAAAAAGNFVGFRVVKTDRPQKRVGGAMIDEGRGVSFGRRGKAGGGRFVQCYDKNLETDGELPAVRLELRTAKKLADHLYREMLDADSDEELTQVMCRAIGGSIDFVERGTETHLDRMPRLAWWAKLLERLGRAKLVVTRTVPPLQRSWEHIKRTILPTLALIRTVAESGGYDFLSSLEDHLDQALDRVRWKRQGRRELGLNLVECFG